VTTATEFKRRRREWRWLGTYQRVRLNINRRSVSVETRFGYPCELNGDQAIELGEALIAEGRRLNDQSDDA
jgi:hypothetical protein